ncbi:MAG: hypothetical protein ACYCPQ_09145 [Elusimicrobiota bacterium]
MILCAASGGAWTQTNSDVARFRAIHRQRADADLAKWQPLLDQYHAGKLDDHDAAAVLYHALTDYGLMRSTGTAEVAEMAKEYQALLKKHPDYVNRRFMRTHAQETAQKQRMQEREQLARERKTFVPKDDYVIGMTQQGDRAMVWYQYRLDFYQVPAGMTLENNGGELALLQDKQDIPLSHAKIVKTMDFVHPFYFNGPFDVVVINAKQDFWFCSELLGGYTAHTSEEHAILGEQAEGYMSHWKNPKGKIESFCGILDIKGDAVYKLPDQYQPQIPQTLIRPVLSSPDGQKIAFEAGRAIEDPIDGDGLAFGGPIQIILWEAPDKLIPLNGVQPNTQESIKIFKQYGLLK